MAFFRGEEGSVNFKNSSGTTELVVSTTGWTLDTTKDTLDVTAHGSNIKIICWWINFWIWNY